MATPRTTATLKEIAERLGLNVGTVSRALNGSDRVREETRALVQRTAAEMRYRPNKSARRLVRGGAPSRFIAVLMPNIVHQFFLGMLKGVIDGLDEASFEVMIFGLRGNRGGVIDRVLDEAPDGVLVFARQLAEEEREAFERRRMPFLYLDYLSDRDPCVYFDNYLGGQVAGRYLLSKEVRSPLYVGLAASSQQQDLRFRGFSDALSTAGIDSFEARYIPHDESQAAKIAKEVLLARRHDGIFFYCDELAYGGLRASRETGLSAAMIGYDDLHLSDLVGLTTVRQEAEAMGRAGARRIAAMVLDAEEPRTARQKTGETQPRALRLEPRLVERST